MAYLCIVSRYKNLLKIYNPLPNTCINLRLRNSDYRWVQIWLLLLYTHLLNLCIWKTLGKKIRRILKSFILTNEVQIRCSLIFRYRKIFIHSFQQIFLNNYQNRGRVPGTLLRDSTFLFSQDPVPLIDIIFANVAFTPKSYKELHEGTTRT